MDAGNLVFDASADAMREAGVGEPAPSYPTEGILPLAPTCDIPRAILGRAFYGDTSLVVRILQAMVAHPEIEVVPGLPVGPRQIALTQNRYGSKNFQASTPTEYAVVARCGDATTCFEIAAMIRAVVPWARPVLICGGFASISEEENPLRGPWKAPEALPMPADRTAVCARVTACAVRLASQPRDLVMRECSKSPLPMAARCAAMDSCSAVVTCWRDR
jgi:hypothetical protein